MTGTLYRGPVQPSFVPAKVGATSKADSRITSIVLQAGQEAGGGPVRFKPAEMGGAVDCLSENTILLHCEQGLGDTLPVSAGTFQWFAQLGCPGSY